MSRPEDPIEEMQLVLGETLLANALRVTTNRGGYVGGGQPHATLDSDSGAVEAVARGLLARKVAEPSRVLPAASPEPTPGLREAACLTCGAPIIDALAGACGVCGAEDRHIGSQWLNIPQDQRPLAASPSPEPTGLEREA